MSNGSPAAAPTAVVVGGGSGIGAALVERYRNDGVEVVVWDLTGEPDLVCDITDPDAITDAWARTELEIGIPDWLTITAGRGHSGRLLDASPEEFDEILRINTRGPWLVMREAAKLMKTRHEPASIVLTSSVSAHLADRGMGLYCASKAALSSLVRVAAAEWAGYGIRVNGVGPGVTHTPMLGGAPTDRGWLADVASRTALHRLGAPDDIAPVIQALHELPWVTGQVLDADGGLTLHSPIDPYGGR